jgi:hypothetical protein
VAVSLRRRPHRRLDEGDERRIELSAAARQQVFTLADLTRAATPAVSEPSIEQIIASELVALKVGDIDSERILLRVEQGKCRRSLPSRKPGTVTPCYCRSFSSCCATGGGTPPPGRSVAGDSCFRAAFRLQFN